MRIRLKKQPEKKPRTPGCLRYDCKYYYTDAHCCGYFAVTGVTRTFLHLGEDVDINHPCREYEQRVHEDHRVEFSLPNNRG